MHDHPAIVLQALQALKPSGLVRRIRITGGCVALYLEDGRVLRREIPVAEATVADPANVGAADVSPKSVPAAPPPAKKPSRRARRKFTPKD